MQKDAEGNREIMGHEDRRNRFEETVFEYDGLKDGRVLIYWQGKHVTTLKGDKARKFLAQVDGPDDRAAQLVMAKVTGNFKRGNERSKR
jgi:hypothetical protein